MSDEFMRGQLAGIEVACAKLRKVADGCEAGGHTRRAQMLRAIAEELGFIAPEAKTELHISREQLKERIAKDPDLPCEAGQTKTEPPRCKPTSDWLEHHRHVHPSPDCHLCAKPNAPGVAPAQANSGRELEHVCPTCGTVLGDKNERG